MIPQIFSLFLFSLILSLPVFAATEQQSKGEFFYTYQNADGNKFVTGKGNISSAIPLDIPLKGVPLWTVAAPLDQGSLWVVALESGEVQGFRIEGRKVTAVNLGRTYLPKNMPPVLKLEAGKATLLTPPLATEASSLTHPVQLKSGKLAYITEKGSLVIVDGDKTEELFVNAMLDSRILTDGKNRILLFTKASSRYDHGVLGDKTEATEISLIETEPKAKVTRSIILWDPSVFEGIAPIWTDLTGNGEKEIIATISDAKYGSRIAVFNEMGTRLGIGKATGQGYRWRHQLAVAPFSDTGSLQIVDVAMPHLAGVVEFINFDPDLRRLNVQSQVSGFSSHAMGSRNLDMAVAGDFDGNNSVELVLPNQKYDELAGINSRGSSAEVAWRVPVGGKISSNLATVRYQDGSLALGVGHSGKILRLWLPAEK